MPKISNKAKLEELLLLFGFEALIQPEGSGITEDELVLVSSLIQSQRYITTRVPKQIQDKQLWWKRALLDHDYCEVAFNSHFRMPKSVFWELCDVLKDPCIFTIHQGPLHLQLAIALYRFGTYGNASSINHVGQKFGVGDGTVVNSTERVINAIRKLSHHYIKWPNQEERKEIGLSMAQKLLPKCIGFVDGTDVAFAEAPRENKEFYWSRKKKYCMQVQIICDPSKIVRDLYVGYPGSVHDAKVFSMSPVGLFPEKYFSEGEFIVGDSAYALTETVVVPFRRSTTEMSSDKKQFNYHLSNKRVAVEHTIGMIKEKFQSLHELRLSVSKEIGHQRVCHWVHACVILHNMLIMKDPTPVCEDTLTLQTDCENELELHDELNNKGFHRRQALLDIYKALK